MSRFVVVFADTCCFIEKPQRRETDSRQIMNERFWGGICWLMTLRNPDIL